MNLKFTNNTDKSMIYDFILDNELVSKEVLDLAVAVGGYNIETLEHIIYYCTAYHNIGQLYNCKPGNFYFSEAIKDWFELDNNNNEDE